MTKPLLTIAIPTYNRASCLNQLLTLLADQVKSEPRVELIISDNASPDETHSLIHDYVARGLPLRYIRNVENIGPDANFLQCFEQARGKYVWLFSDDDLILPGAVAKILSYCEGREYDLIWVSSYAFDKFHTAQGVKPTRDAIDVPNVQAYAKRVHIFFTFISGNIINKDTVVSAGRKPFSSIVGTNLVQLSWAYTALNGFRRGLYIREKLAATRMNNTGGYNLFQVFGSTLLSITTEWLNSGTLSRIVINGAVQRFWPAMLLEYKKIGPAFTDQAEPQDVLTPLFGNNLRYWIFAYPVIVLPFFLARIWVVAVRVVNRLDKALGYPILQWGVPTINSEESRGKSSAGAGARSSSPSDTTLQ